MNELTLSATATCLQCRRETFTLQELKEQQRVIDAQVCSLRVESAHISIEIHLRSVRRPSRTYLVRDDFFAGVKRVPRDLQKPTTSEITLQIAEAKTLLAMMEV
jgi:hypothetical protein